MSKLNQVPVQVGNSFDFNNLRLINVILMDKFSSFGFPGDLRIAIIIRNISDNLTDYDGDKVMKRLLLVRHGETDWNRQHRHFEL